MIGNRYHPAFSSALVASAGTIGPIIPPSVPGVLAVITYWPTLVMWLPTYLG